MSSNNNPTSRLAGIASIAIGGQTYQLAGELTYSPSTIERETLIGQDAVHGYGEKPVPGKISGTLRDSNNLKVADFNAMTSANITLQLANGKTVVGTNMWCTGAQEVKTQDGTFEVKFEGISVREV